MPQEMHSYSYITRRDAQLSGFAPYTEGQFLWKAVSHLSHHPFFIPLVPSLPSFLPPSAWMNAAHCRLTFFAVAAAAPFLANGPLWKWFTGTSHFYSTGSIQRLVSWKSTFVSECSSTWYYDHLTITSFLQIKDHLISKCIGVSYRFIGRGRKGWELVPISV